MKTFKVYNLKQILNLFIFISILLLLFIFSSQNFESVKTSVSLFITNVVPSLFPFIFLTEFTLNTNVINSLARIMGNVVSKLFHTSKNSSSAVVIGFLCGFPMGAKTVGTLYESGLITRSHAASLLCFVNNCNPAFILSTIGIGVFGNIKVGILLAISHYLAALIVGMFFSKPSNKNIIHEKETFLNSNIEKKSKIKENKSFFELIKKSILNSFVTLGMILGFIILFNLVFSIINVILIQLNFNGNIIAVLSALFEITKGSTSIYNLDIPFILKTSVISFCLGFSGLCIISQVYATVSKHKFSFVRLILSKLLQGIFSLAITYILIKYTGLFDISTLNVFNSNDSYAVSTLNNMKISYLISTFVIIIILFVYWCIKKSSLYEENRLPKKEGG